MPAGRPYSAVSVDVISGRVMKKIVAQGNDVAVFLHETGRLRMGGHAYTADIVQLFTLENDLVARFQTYGHMEIHER